MGTKFRIVIENPALPFPTKRGNASVLRGINRYISRTEKGVQNFILEFQARVALRDVLRHILEQYYPKTGNVGIGNPRIAFHSDVPHGSLALSDYFVPKVPTKELAPELMRGTDVVIAAIENTSNEVLDQTEAYQLMPVSQVEAVVDVSPYVLDLVNHNGIGRSSTPPGDLRKLDIRLNEKDDYLEIVDSQTRERRQIALNAPMDYLDRQYFQNFHVAVPRIGSIPQETIREWALMQRLLEIVAFGVLIDPSRARWLRSKNEFVHSFIDGVNATGAAYDYASATSRRLVHRRFGGGFIMDSYLKRTKWSFSTLPNVSIILVSRRPDVITRVLEMLAKQTYKNFEVIVALHGANPVYASLIRESYSELNLTTFAEPEESIFGHVLNKATRMAHGDYVLKVDDDDIYGADFLLDLVIARMCTKADFVGKAPEFTYLSSFNQTVRRMGFQSEAFVDAVAGGTMMMPIDILHELGGWRGVPRHVDRALFQRINEAGGSGYAASPFGFVYVRHQNGHTWDAHDTRFLRKNSEQWHGAPGIEVGV